MHDDIKPVMPAVHDDHEGSMARSELYRAAKYSMKLFQMIEDGQDLEGWVQAKITKSADYLDSVYHYMEYQVKFGDGSHASNIDDITGDAETEISTDEPVSDMDDEERKIDEMATYQQKLEALLEGAIRKTVKGKKAEDKKEQDLDEASGVRASDKKKGKVEKSERKIYFVKLEKENRTKGVTTQAEEGESQSDLKDRVKRENMGWTVVSIREKDEIDEAAEKIAKAEKDAKSKKQKDAMIKEAIAQVVEKAVSKAQQKFMGMVHAAKKGEKPASKEVAKAAKGMSAKSAEDFASTKHKGLPEKVKEDSAWPGTKEYKAKHGTDKERHQAKYGRDEELEKEYEAKKKKGGYGNLGASGADTEEAPAKDKKKEQKQGYEKQKNKVRENNQLVEKFEYSSGTKLGDEELRKRAKDQGYDLDKNIEFDDPDSPSRLKASFKHTPHASLLDPDWSQPSGGLNMRDPEALRRSLDAQMKTQDWQSKSDFDKAGLQALRAQQIIDAEKYQSMKRNPATGAPAKKDPAVLARQQELIKAGAKIKADGIMGPKTQQAEKEFGAKVDALKASNEDRNLVRSIVKKVVAEKKAGKGSKPDYLDFDKDGDKKEPMKKALSDKKKEPIKESTDLSRLKFLSGLK